MKTGFHDPIRPKSKAKKVHNPWTFEAPTYDESKQICAGNNFGVGHRTPVGHSGNAKKVSPSLPKGRINTLNIYPDDKMLDTQ